MSTSLDLAPAHLQIVRHLLATHLPQIEVWAYGSRINGSGHDGSDLDLVLRPPPPGRIDRAALGALRDALEESKLPILVDMLEWTALPEGFQREIERAHITVQARTPSARAP